MGISRGITIALLYPLVCYILFCYNEVFTVAKTNGLASCELIARMVSKVLLRHRVGY